MLDHRGNKCGMPKNKKIRDCEGHSLESELLFSEISKETMACIIQGTH